MNILFCADPLNLRKPDPDFQEEYEASLSLGNHCLLFSYESLTGEHNAADACRRIQSAESPEAILYRGWMLKPQQYRELYHVLSEKSYCLVNTAEEYQHCHYLPESYDRIKEHTPTTVWLRVENSLPDYQAIATLLKDFGNAPLVVKDYVKSQKHYWETACFIPSAANSEKVRTVIENFLALQGSDLNEGIVLREYIPLADLAMHSKSGLPLKVEYRLFFLHKKLIGSYAYWDEGEYNEELVPPIHIFTRIAENINSNFFTMDIALTKQGHWLIIELGDAQVAGLPQAADKKKFYEHLRNTTTSKTIEE